MKFFIFQLWVNNLRKFEEKQKFSFRVNNSKWNLMFYEVELATWKNNFYKNFPVSNSNCEVISPKAILHLENSEPFACFVVLI